MSGFTPATRRIVYERAGYRCERCRGSAYGGSVHHRRPRGMGGDRRPETSSPANALLLCGSGVTGCHGWVESHRLEALDLGLLVPRHADPREIPVTLHVGRVILGDAGEYIPTPEGTEPCLT